MSLNIVLLEPEIPQNTGNIARTCAATGAALHLIEPLGFSIDEKAVRRAGLDYWSKLSLFVYASVEDFFDQNHGPYYYLSTKARRTYDQVSYPAGAYIMFGKESRGLPEELLITNEENCLRIPMKPDIRSLNLSNAVAIVTYEALKQQGFKGMEKAGELHGIPWNEALS